MCMFSLYYRENTHIKSKMAHKLPLFLYSAVKLVGPCLVLAYLHV